MADAPAPASRPGWGSLRPMGAAPKKPGRGAPPKDCEWCPVQGIYIASEASKPTDGNYIRSEDKRKWVLESPLGQGAADALIVAAAAPAPAQKKQKTTQRRKYQPEWKKKYLATLMCCAKAVSFGVTVTALRHAAAPPSCSVGGAECQGCNMCSLMYCSECMIQGTPGIRGCPNPFVQGCSNFHVSSIQNHQKKCYHPAPYR